METDLIRRSLGQESCVDSPGVSVFTRQKEVLLLIPLQVQSDNKQQLLNVEPAGHASVLRSLHLNKPVSEPSHDFLTFIVHTSTRQRTAMICVTHRGSRGCRSSGCRIVVVVVLHVVPLSIHTHRTCRHSNILFSPDTSALARMGRGPG